MKDKIHDLVLNNIFIITIIVVCVAMYAGVAGCVEDTPQEKQRRKQIRIKETERWEEYAMTEQQIFNLACSRFQGISDDDYESSVSLFYIGVQLKKIADSKQKEQQDMQKIKELLIEIKREQQKFKKY